MSVSSSSPPQASSSLPRPPSTSTINPNRISPKGPRQPPPKRRRSRTLTSDMFPPIQPPRIYTTGLDAGRCLTPVDEVDSPSTPSLSPYMLGENSPSTPPQPTPMHHFYSLFSYSAAQFSTPLRTHVSSASSSSLSISPVNLPIGPKPSMYMSQRQAMAAAESPGRDVERSIYSHDAASVRDRAVPMLSSPVGLGMSMARSSPLRRVSERHSRAQKRQAVDFNSLCESLDLDLSQLGSAFNESDDEEYADESDGSDYSWQEDDYEEDGVAPLEIVKRTGDQGRRRRASPQSPKPCGRDSFDLAEEFPEPPSSPGFSFSLPPNGTAWAPPDMPLPPTPSVPKLCRRTHQTVESADMADQLTVADPDESRARLEESIAKLRAHNPSRELDEADDDSDSDCDDSDIEDPRPPPVVLSIPPSHFRYASLASISSLTTATTAPSSMHENKRASRTSRDKKSFEFLPLFDFENSASVTARLAKRTSQDLQLRVRTPSDDATREDGSLPLHSPPRKCKSVPFLLRQVRAPVVPPLPTTPLRNEKEDLSSFMDITPPEAPSKIRKLWDRASVGVGLRRERSMRFSQGQ